MRTSVWALAGSLVFGRWLLSPAAAGAQRNNCALPSQYVEAPGREGYRNRGYGCEGFFVQPQASLNVQVLALRTGTIAFDDKGPRLLYVHIPRELPIGEFDVTVLGSGLIPGLNWALDGKLDRNRLLEWPLDSVVRLARLPADKIGLLAKAVKRERFPTPIYVAVRVTPAEAATPDKSAKADPSPPPTTTMTLRIPAAAQLRWRLSPTVAWSQVRATDGDGRFDLEFPADRHGEVTLEVQWRTRNQRKPWGPTETLKLWLW